MATSSSPHVALAVDFGAGSGRVIAGILEDGILRQEEVHRFPNDGVLQVDTWHWPVGQQFSQALEGLKKARERYGQAIQSIGVDTWGVDYGLVDPRGRLLGLPVQYRDSRTDGMMDLAFSSIPSDELYRATGNQFMPFNTLFQLLAERQRCPGRLETADRLLFMPDLFNFWLTGVKSNEATIASTAQLLHAGTGRWATDVMERLGIPKRLFGDIVQPGTVLGGLLPEVANVTGLQTRVVAVGSHDTASAYAAVPVEEENAVFLSSGTYSLLGTLSNKAVISPESYELNFTNERATGGEIRLLKILCGMWLLQECMREWQKEQPGLDWDMLVDEAEAAEPFLSFIDPDDEGFTAPGGMPARIRAYCRDTHQPVPPSRGHIARVVYESLALKYRLTVEKLQELTGRELGTFHVVGGGSRNPLLNRFTANALNRRVVAGPVEATATGNILSQLQAVGRIRSVQEGVKLVRASFETQTFEPRDTPEWEKAYNRFQRLITTDL